MSSIRRASLMGLVVLLLAPASPSAQAAGAGALAGRDAAAFWFVKTGKKTADFYVAWVTQGGFAFADSEYGVAAHPGSEAFVGKGKCKVRKHSTMCWAGGPGRTVGPTEFSMDPLLSSASLDVQMGKHRQRVTWAGTGNAPQPDAGFGHTTLEGMGAWGGTYRFAKVSGNLFGKRLTAQHTKRKQSFGILFQGAFAAGWLFETGPHGRLSFEGRYPLS